MAGVSISLSKVPHAGVTALQFAEAFARERQAKISRELLLDTEPAVLLEAKPAEGFHAVEYLIAARHGYAYYLTLSTNPETQRPQEWDRFVRDFRWIELQAPATVLDRPFQPKWLFGNTVRLQLPAMARTIPSSDRQQVEEFLIYNLKDQRAEFSVHAKLGEISPDERQGIIQYVGKQMRLDDVSKINFRGASWPDAPANSEWTTFIDGGAGAEGREMWGFVPLSDRLALLISLRILPRTALGDVALYERAAQKIAESLRIDFIALERATSRPTTGPASPDVK